METNNSFKKSLNNIIYKISNHSPEILTGLGITSMLTSVGFGIRGTILATRAYNAEVARRKFEGLPPMDRKELFTLLYKYYILSAISATTGTGLLIASTKISTGRSAGLATACAISETAFKEYRDETIKQLGEKKEEIIKDEIAQKSVDNTPLVEYMVIETGKGDTLCYDKTCGFYFKSSMEAISKAINDANYDMISEIYISLNDLFDYQGLPPVDVGESVGWNLDRGQITPDYSTTLKNGHPCLVVSYKYGPFGDYKSYYR